MNFQKQTFQSLYNSTGLFAQGYSNTDYNNYTYGSNNYSTAPYNGEVEQSSYTPVSSGLVNTGTGILFTATLGSLIIFSALFTRFYKRNKNTS